MSRMRLLRVFLLGVFALFFVNCAHMGPAPTHSAGRTWDDQGVSRPLSEEEGSLILQRTQDLDPSETPASWVPVGSSAEPSDGIPTGCKENDKVELAEYHPFFLGGLKYYKVDMFHLVTSEGEVAVAQKNGVVFFCEVNDDRNFPHVAAPINPRHSLTQALVRVFRDNPDVGDVHIPLQKGESVVKVYPWTREFLSLECVSTCLNESVPHVEVRAADLQDEDSVQDNDGP